MNTRDPFNVRQKPPRSPLQVVQSHDFFGAPSSTGVNQNQFTQELHHPRQLDSTADVPYIPAAGGSTTMANSDTSSTSDSQRTEWRPRRLTNGRTTSVGEKFANMMSTNEEEELPMYKDKPYNYATSRRRVPFYKRKTIIFLLIVISSITLYFSGALSRISTDGMIDEATFKRPLTLFTGSKSAVIDWDERRERVRDAFQISWEAYEKHAWGE